MLLVAALMGLQALAIPAHRGFVPMPQPDGSMVSIGLVGDEYYHYNITEDGYTLMFDERGAYVYAQREGDTLIPTTILAHNEGERDTAELALLAITPKHLTDRAEVQQANIRRAKRNVDLSNFDFANFRGLVILVDFADKTFNVEDPKTFYTEMFSTENLSSFIDPLTGNEVNVLGSVRDYFSDQSNGAFAPPFDVYGPYTTTRKAAQGNNYATTIFTNAVKEANAEIDFTRYDNNKDGKVDMIYFLVAGYSSSYEGNNKGYLWPHASNLSFYSGTTYDGKRLDRYACSTELYGFEGTPSTVKVEGIGTICHEFSHVLGLPDFYDTDYEDGGGKSHDPGGWDVMAGGADYNYGRSPVGYTFYERYALGWAQANTITESGEYSLEPVNTAREGYILRTPVENEFFTIENRQRTGWDSYLPGHGMIVTRVDSTNTSIWSNNKVNANPAHNYFELLRAGNSTSGDSGSDPFPGTLGNPMLTNETLPNLKTWAGKNNDFCIVGIQEHDGIISFNVVENDALFKAVEDFESMPVSSGTTDADVKGKLANWTFNKSGVRAPGEELANGENSVLMKLPSQFYSVTPVYYDTYLAQLTVFNPTTTLAKYSLDYSVDGGQTWTKALTPTGATTAEVPSKTNGNCYWNLNLDSKTPVQFRVSQMGGNKNSPTYVDDFTLYYNQDGQSTLPGDVNGDGKVNISDINVIIQVILSGNGGSVGDVNGDGQVNISDVNFTIAIILKNN